MASLLFVSKTFFYFLPPPKSEEEQDEEQGDEQQQEVTRRDDLIFCAIQLLHHWNSKIVKEASDLLVLALAYGPPNAIVDYVIPLFESLKLCFVVVSSDNNNNNNNDDNPNVFAGIQNISAAVAHLSPHFYSFLCYIFN